MQITNQDGKFICLDNDESGKRYMRLSSAEIKQGVTQTFGTQDRDYLWYVMEIGAWLVTDPQELEAQYQQLLKEQACKLN